MTTNPTVRGLEARRASLAPGAYLGIVHVSPGERLGPIGRGAVLPEVLDHVEAIETELAESRAAHGRELETSIDLKTRLAASVLACDSYRDEVDSLRSSVTLAGAALGVTSDDPAEVVRFARLAAEEVALRSSAIARIRVGRGRGDGGGERTDEALRVLDEGLARSRGAR